MPERHRSPSSGPRTETGGPTDAPRNRSRLEGEDLVVGYGPRPVIDGLDITVPTGELSVIVGPNACGKSTLLRALARMLPLRRGQVFLDGATIGTYAPKEVARRLGLLPQSPVAPEGIVVEDLVARGRYPHQRVLQWWSEEDQRAVEHAMERAGVVDLAQRPVLELSGGQRQRVWIALALAQDTPVLLLDEPTTYLDIAHQVEVLDLARSLQEEGTTVVLVLHELNLAFRYATHLIVMSAGEVVARGNPREIVTPQLLHEVYGLACRVLEDPESGAPLVVPRAH